MDIRDLLKKLTPLKKRMHINRGIYRFLLCLCIGSALAMLLSYASLLIPIPFLLRVILYVYLASAALGLVISLFSVPKTRDIIKGADALGLKERVTTAWQLQKENTPIALLQRQDAYESVKASNFKSLYPILFPKKLTIALCVSIILTSISFAAPTLARDSAKKLEELQNVVEEQLEEMERVEEKLKKDGMLTEEELEKISNELERLSEELKKAKTEDEALKAVSRAENELEKLDIEKQLNKLGEMLSQYEMTEDLGQSIAKSNATDMKQALEQLISQMEQEEISPEELKKLLEEVSEQMDNKELSEQLEKAAKALSEEDIAANAASLENLKQALSEMMEAQSGSSLSQAAGQLSQALQNAKSSISRVDSSISQGSSSNPSKPSDKAIGQGQSPGQGQSQGQGKGQAPGQGQSQGQGKGQTPGQGQGEGEGQQGGGGAGEGSTNEDAGYTGSEQAGGGRKPGEGMEEAYEKLYDPDYLGGDADPSYVSGQPGEGGESSYSQNDNMPVKKGAILPYNEVLGRYTNRASSYMEEAEIPAAMKDIVRQYFESLE